MRLRATVVVNESINANDQTTLSLVCDVSKQTESVASSSRSAVPVAGGGQKRPLIEEIPSSGGILRPASTSTNGAFSNAVAEKTNGIGPAAPHLSSPRQGSSLKEVPDVEEVSVEEMGRRMSLPPMRWSWAEESGKVRIEVDVTSLVSCSL